MEASTPPEGIPDGVPWAEDADAQAHAVDSSHTEGLALNSFDLFWDLSVENIAHFQDRLYELGEKGIYYDGIGFRQTQTPHTPDGFPGRSEEVLVNCALIKSMKWDWKEFTTRAQWCRSEGPAGGAADAEDDDDTSDSGQMSTVEDVKTGFMYFLLRAGAFQSFKSRMLEVFERLYDNEIILETALKSPSRRRCGQCRRPELDLMDILRRQ